MRTHLSGNRLLPGSVFILAVLSCVMFCTPATEDTEETTDDTTTNCDHRYPDYDGSTPPGVPADQLYFLRQDWPKEPVSLPDSVTRRMHSFLPLTSGNVTDFMFYMRGLVFADLAAVDFSQRDAKWYAVPHMGKREAMHGMYDGNNINPGVWDTQQVDTAINFTTDLYNQVSAYTIGQMWGDCSRSTDDPLINKSTNQFNEGSIVIKLAMTALPLEQAPFLNGAFNWQVYADPNGNTTDGAGSYNPQMLEVHLIQMDVIVKDRVMAPETGWVFSTFVYDRTSEPIDMPPGTPADMQGLYKMVPLGAMWGNDPDNTTMDLKETVLNPRWNTPPQFIANTLGFNGRLSGPIDDVGNRSSCMQCHMSAEWNTVNMQEDQGQVFATLGYPEVQWTDAQKIPWFQNFNGLQSFGNTPVSDEVTRYLVDSIGITPGPDWIGMDYDFVMTAAALDALQDRTNVEKNNILVGKHH